LRTLKKRKQPEPRPTGSVQTLGEKLRHAREEKQLALEDVARETRMRPERIADIEQDEFANFPNIAYARSFVLLYAKFLGVDVADMVQTLQTATRVGVDDYDYLQNAPSRVPPRVRARRQRSALPVFFLIGAVILVLFVIYLMRQSDRLGPEYDGVSEQKIPVIVSEESPSASTPAPERTPTPIPNAVVAPPAPPTPQIHSSPEASKPVNNEELPVRKAEPVE
jgi:cytoskeleton protein RodZ